MKHDWDACPICGRPTTKDKSESKCDRCGYCLSCSG